MQHAEFRRLFGANPRRTDTEVLAHRAQCAQCARYAQDLERVDQLVARALEVPGPAHSHRPWEQPRRSALRWYALAASLLVLIAAGTTFWFAQRRDALIVEVVKHADRERDVLVASDKRVAGIKVQNALAKVDALMTRDLPVSIARVCKIRGNLTPHLILQTRDGAVAILLLSKERTWIPHSFAKLGYQGTFVSMGSHSIAVIGTSESAVAEGAKLASGAITWPPE